MSNLRITVAADTPGPARRNRGSNARAPRFGTPETIPAWALLRFILRLPAGALLLLIRIYQRILSPVLPAIFGSACGCRFAPTCSHYAAEAIRTHGVIIGVVLAAIRLLKCTPLHPGGFDPVPPRRSRLRCERLTRPELFTPLS